VRTGVLCVNVPAHAGRRLASMRGAAVSAANSSYSFQISHSVASCTVMAGPTYVARLLRARWRRRRRASILLASGIC
jgi:hypothetical protein